MDLEATMQRKVGDLSVLEMAHVLRRMGITPKRYAALLGHQVSDAGRVDETRKDRHVRRNLSAR